ncbi:MAG: hypothetical protein ACW99Q_26825 [Candidatus Kariarchaeaceae archaeon]|jgi:hypothetical protein
MNLKLKLISLMIIINLPLAISVDGETYNSNELTSTGLSKYIHHIETTSTDWTRGVEFQFSHGITVNSFGSGILDFHEIEFRIRFTNNADFELNMINTFWGTINTPGNSYTKIWKVVPTDKWPDQFSIYGHSQFYEDVGIGDPFTDDGWTLIGIANQFSAKWPQPETVTTTVTTTNTIITTVGGDKTSTIFKTSTKSEAELNNLFLVSLISINFLIVIRKIRSKISY